MIVLVIIGILFAVGLLGYGILLLFAHKWVPKLLALFWSKSPQPSTALNIGIWKFRARGIVYIMASILLLMPIVVPNVNYSIPLMIAVIAITANFVFGLVILALPTKNKKAGQKKSP